MEYAKCRIIFFVDNIFLSSRTTSPPPPSQRTAAPAPPPPPTMSWPREGLKKEKKMRNFPHWPGGVKTVFFSTLFFSLLPRDLCHLPPAPPDGHCSCPSPARLPCPRPAQAGRSWRGTLLCQVISIEWSPTLLLTFKTLTLTTALRMSSTLIQ